MEEKQTYHEASSCQRRFNTFNENRKNFHLRKQITYTKKVKSQEKQIKIQQLNLKTLKTTQQTLQKKIQNQNRSVRKKWRPSNAKVYLSNIQNLQELKKCLNSSRRMFVKKNILFQRKIGPELLLTIF